MSRRSTTPNKTENITINNISNITPILKAAIIDHHIEQDVVIYTVKIIDEQSGEIWNFESRFSEFYQLNSAIIHSKKIPISDLPKFPKKKHLWTNNKDPQLIIKRRKKLELFLNHILTNERVKNLECVINFVLRSKREFEIFQKINSQNSKQTVNLAKNVEKNFLDEIDSNMSNSDFMEIMEKYEDYEKDKEECPQRTASKFLDNYKRAKTLQNETNEYNDFPNDDDFAIKLQKVKSSETKKNNDEDGEIIENLENSKTMDAIHVNQNTPVKTVKRTSSVEREKVKVVYMSPLLKIERSGSIKKQEMLKRSETKYSPKKSVLKSYFHGLCGGC